MYVCKYILFLEITYFKSNKLAFSIGDFSNENPFLDVFSAVESFFIYVNFGILH